VEGFLLFSIGVYAMQDGVFRLHCIFLALEQSIIYFALPTAKYLPKTLVFAIGEEQ
jgi:hypothetical protein